MPQMSDARSAGLGQGVPAPPGLLEQTIARLTHVRRGQSPRRALEVALARRDEIAPFLLDEVGLAPADIEGRYESEPDRDTVYYLHTFACFLLGLFRDPRAYEPLLDYFASDSVLADELSGEALSGYLPSLLVRCYDGSGPSRLRLMVETEAFEPLLRYECLQAYHGLALTGHVAKADVVDFVGHLLDAVPADATYDGWYAWLALAAAELQAPALRQRIEALFDRGLTGREENSFFLVADKADIADIYATPSEKIAASILNDDFFDSFIDRVCRWYWFQKPKDDRLGDPVSRALNANRRHMPFVGARTKIGRNDPCLCGSGKKYKKCCLNKVLEFTGSGLSDAGDVW